MKGFMFYKGDISIEDGELVMVEDSELLKYELENFILCDPLTCQWDINRGLDRKIIFSSNESSIKSEIRTKILKYFSDRVSDVYDIDVTIESGSISVEGTMETIYGTLTLNTERRI